MIDWQAIEAVADTYKGKAKYQDRDDLKGDIVLRLAELANARAEPLSKPTMLRIASYVVMEYWHDIKRQPTMVSLYQEVDDDYGDSLELWETIADDTAIDLDRWLDAKTWLAGCPQRLVAIAYKRVIGKPLDAKEKKYLSRWRQKGLAKAQKLLF